MTQDDIPSMAREAGFYVDENGDILEGDNYSIQTDLIERFAALVAKSERDRCVDILMRLHERSAGSHNYYHFAANQIAGESVAREHRSSGDCWCNPELNYVDPVTGVEVWVHKEPQ